MFCHSKLRCLEIVHKVKILWCSNTCELSFWTWSRKPKEVNSSQGFIALIYGWDPAIQFKCSKWRIHRFPLLCTDKENSYITYKQLALVQVFASPIRIFDFFAEDQGHLKEEEVPVAALTNQSLGIPHLEGLLKYQLSLGVNVSIKSWSSAGRKENPKTKLTMCGSLWVANVILFKMNVELSTYVWVFVHPPSSIDRCMASLAFFGTLSITSSPSLISPLPSSQHVNNSYNRSM